MELGNITPMPPPMPVDDWLTFETVTGQAVHIRAACVRAIEERLDGTCRINGDGFDHMVVGEHEQVLQAVRVARKHAT